MRTHRQNPCRGLAQVRFAGKQARLAVVDQQEIPFGDGRQQLLAVVLDPEIHGVAAGQAQAVHLRANAALERRLDVAQQQIRLLAVAFRQFRMKSAKTFNSVASVSRSFMSAEYLPAQKNVLPGTRSRPSRSTPRPASSCRSCSAKSSPTTPTRRGRVKKLAAREI